MNLKQKNNRGVSFIEKKYLFWGLSLFLLGLSFSYLAYFVYPEVYLGSGVGLGGIFSLLAPVTATLLGLALICFSLSKTPKPQMALPTDFILDERIDIEGAESVNKEVEKCKRYLKPKEKLIALFVGNLEGKPTFNRLAITKKRLIFYSQTNPLNSLAFNYEQIDTVRAIKGKILTHLGEINLTTSGNKLRFTNVLEADSRIAADLIRKMREK